MFGGTTIEVARYGLPGAVLGVALAWFAGGQGAAVRAQPTGPGGEFLLTHPTQAPSRPIDTGTGRNALNRAAISGESSGTIGLVVPSNNGSDQWFYLIDTKAHSFAVYRMDVADAKPTIKLEVARQYGWDLKLDRYNNSGLEPAAIEKVVKSLVQQTKH